MSTARSIRQFYYPRADAKLLPNIPHDLTKFKSWVVWEEMPNGSGGKYRKMPLNPLTLNGEDWNNPNNWSYRATATQVFTENPTLRGPGFVFSDADPYAFFDLDGVISNGKLAPWATEFVRMVNSYTEVSNSGTGVKVIVKANVGDRAKTFEFRDSNGDAHELEVYDCNRFFAATGNRWEDTPPDIADRQELLDVLHPLAEDEELGPPIDRATDAYAEDVDAISDADLLGKIRASKKQGKKFQRLMDGNKAGYSGNFAASGALCAILAFWTRANPERIDRLFRQSKLFVDWWWEQKAYSGKRSRSQYVIDDACKRAASKEMYTPPSTGLIVSDDGKVKAVMANAIALLKTNHCWKGVLAFNELTLSPLKLKATPWSERTGAWTDYDDTKLLEWMQRHGVFIPSSKQAGEAANTVAYEHRFHPVRDYLDALRWDEKPRLDTWLPTYLGARDSDFTRGAGRCWMLSGVARIYLPGCKVDYVLTLEGPQGRLKSRALNTLAGGDEFFLDDFSNFEDKDEKLKLHGAWIVELTELAGTRRDINKVKSFLTSKDDVFRAPYDKRTLHHPRMNIFAGSTNEDKWLTDETGGRRFWPVKCGAIDIERLEKDRDQLWAEAVVRFRANEKWWFETQSLNDFAEEEQRKRYQAGQWDQTIEGFLDFPTQDFSWESQEKGPAVKRYVTPWDSSEDEVTVDDILLHAIKKPLDRRTHADALSVAKCLKHNHWTPDSVRRGRRVLRIWRRPNAVTA